MTDDTNNLGRLHSRVGELAAARDITLTELAERVGISPVNLSVLKNDRAKAIRYTTLIGLCDALNCQPGDLFVLAPHPSNAQDG
ncbi:helix-turn-helix transcriptional regulator [uncultured Agrococcus sp.]|uniref:helix-turn-helix domain-containing protein n=1 Tax=uncultured Agrococcus sp. TaxID=382258 RepID=UPI0025F738C9|nr:helix-turn-helix transcriptional regulator [uncultured Agrococcus sp.]